MRRKSKLWPAIYESDGQIDLRELIARRAYEIYEERGMRHGDDINDWLRPKRK